MDSAPPPPPPSEAAAPPPPAPAKRSRTGLRIALIVLLLAAAGGGGYAAMTLLGGDDDPAEPGQAATTESSEAPGTVVEGSDPSATFVDPLEEGDAEILWIEPTYDQERILAEFGWPHSFYIVFGPDLLADDFGVEGPLPIHRLESWDYLDLGFRVNFRNGLVTGSEDLTGLPEAPVRPGFHPLMFLYPMSSSQVEAVLASAPTGRVEADPEVVDFRVDSFFGQLFVSYQDDVVVAVQAPWLETGEGSE